jgi:hypothetical protein
MKKIILLCMGAFLSVPINNSNMYAQVIVAGQVTDVGANAQLGAISATQTKIWVDKIEKDLKEVTRYLDDNKEFFNNVQDVKKTIQLMTQLMCLLDEILRLEQVQKRVGYNSCLGNIGTEITTLRLRSNITLLVSLMTSVIKTSTGSDKASKWSEATKNLSEIHRDLIKERNLIVQAIAIGIAIDEETQSKKGFLNDRWNMRSASARMK